MFLIFLVRGVLLRGKNVLHPGETLLRFLPTGEMVAICMGGTS